MAEQDNHLRQAVLDSYTLALNTCLEHLPPQMDESGMLCKVDVNDVSSFENYVCRMASLPARETVACV